MSEEEFSYVFKIVIVGDSGVGKSNIFTRFIQDEFNIDSKATIGVEFSAKNITIKNKVIKAQVWDTAGQERFRALAKSYYRGAVGALLVYDITNYETFKDIKKWLKEVKDYADSHLVTLLIGNKNDLEEQRAVKTEEGAELAESQGLGFVETSAKTNLNIEEAFTRLVTQVVEKLEKVEAEEKSEENKGPQQPDQPKIGGGETVTIGTNPKNTPNKSKDCAC